MSSRACFSGWNNKSVQLSALKFQLCFNVLEFLVQVSGESGSVPPQIYRHLVPPIKWQSSRKEQRQIKPAFVSLTVSLHTCMCAAPVCGPPTDQSAGRLCPRLWLPAWLYLSVCIGATWPARCPGSFSEHDWLAGWLTFGLIRVTYRRAAGTHKHIHAHTNITAQAAYSACNWPEPLAWTTNHPLISTTALWVCQTCSLISFTSCFGQAAVFPYFRRLHQWRDLGIWQNTSKHAHVHTHKEL